MIGRTISHFRVLARIGAGGMGVVYEAEDLKLHRRVAIKVLPPGVVDDPERRRRFLREARAAAAVAHPNIATIYEVDEADGVIFIAMELVVGRTLRECLADGALSHQDVTRIGAAIAEGLGSAHRAHVIHRDLKPENVIVRPDGSVKLLDFGLAKLHEMWGEDSPSGLSQQDTVSMTREGRLVGTVAYMSPEQARGKAVDARSDLFTLGMILYEMATGQRPFKGEAQADLLSAILRDEPVPAATVNPLVTSDLENVIGRCLEKDPGRRYQTAEEIEEALDRLEASGPVLKPIRWRAVSRHWRATVFGFATALVVLVAALNVGGWRERWLGGAGTAPIESLAVLPFQNLSGNPEQEYFVDGMTEALTTELAKIGSLKVISRTSVMRYRDTERSLPRIAGELNVDAVVEGSALRVGDRVRVTAQLIHVETDRHLWAESYERDLRDVLALQNEVARSIAREIRAKLTPQEEERLARLRPVAPEVYEAYLKGQYYANKCTQGASQKSIQFFEQAIGLDPAYAPAYAGLGEIYLKLGLSVCGAMEPELAHLKAKAAAKKALEIDDGLVEVHDLLGRISAFNWDWSAAEMEYRRAKELNPNYLGDSLYLMLMGRQAESIAAGKRAREMDPASPMSTANLGVVYHYWRQYDAAIEQYGKALELEPDHIPTLWVLGQAYLKKAMYDEAISVFQHVLSLSPGDTWSRALSVYAYGMSGRREEALRLQNEVERLRLERPVSVDEISMAVMSTGLGKNDQAIQWLQRACEKHVPYVPLYLGNDPILEPLYSDPRIQDLRRRVGLPPLKLVG